MKHDGFSHRLFHLFQVTARPQSVRWWAIHHVFWSKWWLNGGSMGFYGIYPLVLIDSLLLKMAMEMFGFPMKHGDFP